MFQVRHSNERGEASLQWLHSRHTFSFARYYDPEQMGVSSLRVINDDIISTGNGFPMHSHQDMEILSYIKRGTIEHKDDLGNVKIISAGEFQLMSAGSGITHSEYNHSSEPLELLQIWLQPNVVGTKPTYQQQKFAREQGLQLIASPEGSQSAFQIKQDAYIYRLNLLKNTGTAHTLNRQRIAYVHVISGHLTINGQLLDSGDGVTITETESINFTSVCDAEALLFDLA